MPERKTRRTSKRRAIQNALGQLGWHAGGKDVVALLASYGIEVSEGLVSRVKVESLKKAEEVKRQETKMQQTGRQAKTPVVREVPQQREYRR